MSNEINAQIIFSEGFESQSDQFSQRNMLVNPIQVMRSPFIPTALSLNITVLVKGMIPNESYSITINLINLANGETTFNQNIDSLSIPAGMDNINFNFELKNVPFENEGDYECQFEVNGLMFKNTMTVKKNEKPEQ